MKILIVSGFLGAGKTTFIKRLARNVDQRFAILENEYGAAGIDGARLGQNRQGTQKNVWEMTEQCICCIGKKDFAASVLTIANVVDPEYLIVEPTGVGSLARIIENLRQIEYERIQLLSPVTIVDVYSYRRYMAEYPELYQDQIRSADTIIVSKTEACQAEEKQRIQKFLQEINPQAKIITDYASTMTPTHPADAYKSASPAPHSRAPSGSASDYKTEKQIQYPPAGTGSASCRGTY